ncbi:MAG: hypothetical protein ACE5K2_02090, partial [Candidatus Zixiibacteriota bacterium]
TLANPLAGQYSLWIHRPDVESFEWVETSDGTDGDFEWRVLPDKEPEWFRATITTPSFTFTSLPTDFEAFSLFVNATTPAEVLVVAHKDNLAITPSTPLSEVYMIDSVSVGQLIANTTDFMDEGISLYPGSYGLLVLTETPTSLLLDLTEREILQDAGGITLTGEAPLIQFSEGLTGQYHTLRDLAMLTEVYEAITEPGFDSYVFDTELVKNTLMKYNDALTGLFLRADSLEEAYWGHVAYENLAGDLDAKFQLQLSGYRHQRLSKATAGELTLMPSLRTAQHALSTIHSFWYKEINVMGLSTLIKGITFIDQPNTIVADLESTLYGVLLTNRVGAVQRAHAELGSRPTFTLRPIPKIADTTPMYSMSRAPRLNFVPAYTSAASFLPLAAPLRAQATDAAQDVFFKQQLFFVVILGVLLLWGTPLPTQIVLQLNALILVGTFLIQTVQVIEVVARWAQTLIKQAKELTDAYEWLRNYLTGGISEPSDESRKPMDLDHSSSWVTRLFRPNVEGFGWHGLVDLFYHVFHGDRGVDPRFIQQLQSQGTRTDSQMLQPSRTLQPQSLKPQGLTEVDTRVTTENIIYGVSKHQFLDLVLQQTANAGEIAQAIKGLESLETQLEKELGPGTLVGFRFGIDGKTDLTDFAVDFHAETGDIHTIRAAIDGGESSITIDNVLVQAFKTTFAGEFGFQLKQRLMARLSAWAQTGRASHHLAVVAEGAAKWFIDLKGKGDLDKMVKDIETLFEAEHIEKSEEALAVEGLLQQELNGALTKIEETKHTLGGLSNTFIAIFGTIQIKTITVQEVRNDLITKGVPLSKMEQSALPFCETVEVVQLSDEVITREVDKETVKTQWDVMCEAYLDFFNALGVTFANKLVGIEVPLWEQKGTEIVPSRHILDLAKLFLQIRPFLRPPFFEVKTEWEVKGISEDELGCSYDEFFEAVNMLLDQRLAVGEYQLLTGPEFMLAQNFDQQVRMMVNKLFKGPSTRTKSLGFLKSFVTAAVVLRAATCMDASEALIFKENVFTKTGEKNNFFGLIKAWMLRLKEDERLAFIAGTPDITLTKDFYKEFSKLSPEEQKNLLNGGTVGGKTLKNYVVYTQISESEFLNDLHYSSQEISQEFEGNVLALYLAKVAVTAHNPRTSFGQVIREARDMMQMQPEKDAEGNELPLHDTIYAPIKIDDVEGSSVIITSQSVVVVGVDGIPTVISAKKNMKVGVLDSQTGEYRSVDICKVALNRQQAVEVPVTHVGLEDQAKNHEEQPIDVMILTRGLLTKEAYKQKYGDVPEGCENVNYIIDPVHTEYALFAGLTKSVLDKKHVAIEEMYLLSRLAEDQGGFGITGGWTPHSTQTVGISAVGITPPHEGDVGSTIHATLRTASGFKSESEESMESLNIATVPLTFNEELMKRINNPEQKHLTALSCSLGDMSGPSGGIFVKIKGRTVFIGDNNDLLSSISNAHI